MNESETTTLGLRIQTGRKAAGLSQEALGERLGVSRQAVSKWESDIAIPELENLIAMSRLFGVSVGVLLGVEEAETASSLSEQELQAAQAIAEKYAEQIKPSARPWWKALAAVVLVCAIIVGAVQWQANRRITDLNEQLITLQTQMNGIQNGVAGQLSAFTSQMHSILEEQSSNVFNTSAKIMSFDVKNGTVVLNVTATAKEWDENTTGQFTATMDDGSIYTSDAVCNNGVYTAENWALPRDADGNFITKFSITLRNGDGARTSPMDVIYAYPRNFRPNITGTTSVNINQNANTVTLFSVYVHYDGDGYPSFFGNVPAAIDCDFCIYRNDAAQPETVVPLTDVTELLQNNSAMSFHSSCSLGEYGMIVQLSEGDTVLFVLRVKDRFGNVFYSVMDGLMRDEYGLANLNPTQDIDLKVWTPGDISNLKFGRG